MNAKNFRDKYFYIDYIRLHKYGIEKKIWKRNKNMIQSSAEYDPSTKSRQGYQSYIQRALKPIIEYIYPDFLVFKPRSTFGYEIGEKNSLKFNTLKTTEEKISFIISRYFLYHLYANEVNEYCGKIKNSKIIDSKNNYRGLIVNLNRDKPDGFLAVKELEEIREKQEEILKLFDNPDKLIQDMAGYFLNKARKPTSEDIFFVMEETTNSGYFGLFKDEEQNSQNDLFYYLYLINSAGDITENIKRISIGFIDYNKRYNKEIIDNKKAERIKEIIKYCKDNFKDARLDIDSKIKLAKSALIKSMEDKDKIECYKSTELSEADKADIEADSYVSDDIIF